MIADPGRERSSDRSVTAGSISNLYATGFPKCSKACDGLGYILTDASLGAGR